LKPLTHRVTYAPGDSFTLYPLGDVHFGSANCAVGEFIDTVQRIKADPGALWIGMGDFVEAIAPNDKRFSAGGIDQNVIDLGAQDRIGDVFVEKMGAVLAPIASKCVAYLNGNHEQVFDKHYYTALSCRILDAAGIDSGCYVPWAGLIRLAFEDHNNHRGALRIFAAHGWQAGRMDGAKVNEARRLMAYVDADIYLQGHSHSRFVIPQSRIAVNPSWTKITEQKAYIAHTGSFLKTLEQDQASYAERAGYPPTSLGTIRFHITPKSDALEVEAVT
jgi:predicted phosphodiesterase